MNQNNILGERIKGLRTEQKISQDDLAKALRISRLTIGKYERGERIPDADTIKALSHIFYVSADYLLGLSDAKNPDNELFMDELGLSEDSINFIKNLKNVIIPKYLKDKRTNLDVFIQLLSDDTFEDLLHNIRESTSKDNMIENGDKPNTHTYSSSTNAIDAFEKRAMDKLKNIMQEIRTSEYLELIEGIK